MELRSANLLNVEIEKIAQNNVKYVSIDLKDEKMINFELKF